MLFTIDAQKLSRHRVAHRGEEWTITHAQFAVAGSIRLRNVHGNLVPNRQRSLREAIQSGGIREPPISEEELRSRSKSDWIIKLVVICQIAWFALRALFRAIQHVQVTALEIMTVGIRILLVCRLWLVLESTSRC